MDPTHYTIENARLVLRERVIEAGRLAPGLRADFVRIRKVDLPVVRGVWREGRRVV